MTRPLNASRSQFKQSVSLLPLQDLMKGLAASTGQSDDAVEMPFISGTFEYGGRAAARRKVYMFANKAQDQSSLTDATVQFLGVFKTDKKASPLWLLLI